MTYDDREIWVTRWVETGMPVQTQNSLLASVMTLGWIPIALNGLYYLLRGGHASRGFLIAELFITLLISSVPFLIWHWNRHVFPDFFQRTSTIIRDQDRLDQIEDKYTSIFSEKYLLVSVPWALAALAGFLGNAGYFAGQGISGPATVVYWIYILLFAWSGFITGIGVHIILITLLCIREVAELPLCIDPLYPDSLGGLSAVGYFAIWTTLLASTGSLALPLAFELAAKGGFEILIYITVVIYAAAIGLLFFYPTIKINQQAKEKRDDILNEYRLRINELEGMVDLGDPEPVSTQDLARQLEIQRLRQRFEDYQNMKLYPMSLGILSRLVSAVLLPLTFVFLQIYLPEWL